MNVRDLALEALRRVPEVDVPLEIEPELGGRPEELAQPQRHLGADRAPLAQELVDGLPRDAEGLGERRDRQVVLGQEVLAQDLAGMDRAPLERLRVRNAHGRLALVVVAELDVVRITVGEPEADAPLVADGDRMLAGAIALERVQTIAGRHLEIGDLGRGVHRLQLAQGTAGDIRGHPLGLAGSEQRFGGPVREGLDHGRDVTRNVTRVNAGGVRGRRPPARPKLAIRGPRTLHCKVARLPPLRIPLMPRLGLSSLDLRVGFRMLARYPILTAASTIALAVAIALGVLYFEATDKMRNPRLPIAGADRVIQLHQWDPERMTEEARLLHDFGQWRGAMRTVEQLGAVVETSRNLTTSDRRTEPVRGAEATASAFVVAGTPALHGRTLLPRDEEPGAPPVVVLGHGLWKSRFDSDPGVIGQDVAVGTVTATIVGVMPAGFAFPGNEQLWMALRTDAVLVAPRDGPPITVFGRLADGATLADADAELAVLATRLAAASPETHARLRPRATPFGKPLAEGGERKTINTILVAVNSLFLMLLAIMSANVATLVSARTTTRSWEFTVRTALGASRASVVRQLFAEALVLTTLATIVGLVVARIALGIGVDRLALTGALPYWITPTLSWRTLLYAAVLAVFGALIVGVLPALRVARMDIQSALRSGRDGAGALKFGGFWTALIVVQVAVTVLLLPLVGNGVMESKRFGQRAAGIDAERYAKARVWMAHEEHGLDSAAHHARALGPVAELERRLAAEPGVQAVAFADRLPVEDQFKYRIEIDTAIGKPATTNRHSTLVHVAGDFFRAFGTEVVMGRDFQPLDYETGRVMLVNQSFAQHVLGGANPVGWRIRIAAGEISGVAGEEWYEIVGMVRDFGWQLPRPEEQSAMYLPSRPVTGYASQVVVRAADPDSVLGRMRTIAREVDPTLQLGELERLGGAGSGEASVNWTLTSVVGLVSGLVMLLSAMGIHALMSFTVSRRTREIGIRVALGAGARRIVTSIFRRAFLQLAAGLVIGSGIGVLLGMQSALQVRMLVGANLLMLVVGMIACAVPVRRALRIEPSEALRADG